MRYPAIIVNFKAYSQVEGQRSLALATICQEVSEESGVDIAVCPPATEISSLSRTLRIPVWAQHTDPRSPGAATGYLTPQMISSAGAVGTLLNHSERRMVLADIGMAVTMSRGVGLETCVCTDSECTSAAAASLGPDMIAVEPPELIGGDVSVTDAQPEIVSRAVAAVKRVDDGIKVLCGAGVKTGLDVKKAVELGASGILLASGVVKASDPRKVLADLVHHL
jgi:triosephosphate isomerase (TIM)